MSEQHNQNLLKKLFNKNLIKKASTIVLTAGVIIGGTACNNTPDTTTTTSQQQNNNNNQNQDISQYSQLLQNVLTDEYYNSLIYEIENSNKSVYSTGKYGAHPFAFLEDEGVDVEAIRAGTLPCYTMSYVLENEPNNLYMYSRVTYPNEGYCENYVVKYTLTDKEMKDYHLMMSGSGSIEYYIQAAFMNNEISETKKPEIVGYSKIKTTTFEKLCESADMSNLYEKGIGETWVVLNTDIDNHLMEALLLPDYNNSLKIYKPFQVDNINCIASIRTNGDIITNPVSYGQLGDKQHNIQNAKIYFTDGFALTYTHCKDITENN